MKQELPAIGEVFEFPYPFVRATYEALNLDVDGMSVTEVPTWKPGVRFEDAGMGWVNAHADGCGAQIVTVVGVYQPKGFPTRVFYVRRWRNPDGKEFGKGLCRMKTIGAFRSLVRGYSHQIDYMAGKRVA